MFYGLLQIIGVERTVNKSKKGFVLNVDYYLLRLVLFISKNLPEGLLFRYLLLVHFGL
jgi:hypothetical protein